MQRMFYECVCQISGRLKAFRVKSKKSGGQRYEKIAEYGVCDK